MNIYLKLFIFVSLVVLFLISAYFSIRNILIQEYYCEGFSCIYDDYFYSSNFDTVSLYENTLVVGESSNYDGFVLIFERTSVGFPWVRKYSIAKDKGSICNYDICSNHINIDLDYGDSRFRTSVSIDRNTLAVGTLGDYYVSGNTKTKKEHKKGSIYIFEKENSTWNKKYEMSSNDECNKGFECIKISPENNLYVSSLKLYGKTLFVGSVFDDDGGENKGAVYIFEKENNIWNKKYKISNNKNNQDLCKEFTCINVDLNPNDNFGSRIDIEGEKIIITSGEKIIIIEGERHTKGGSEEIKRNVFKKQSGVYKWIGINLETPLKFFGSDNFSLQGNSLVVLGHPRTDRVHCGDGAIYTFERKSKNNPWLKGYKISCPFYIIPLRKRYRLIDPYFHGSHQNNKYHV